MTSGVFRENKDLQAEPKGNSIHKFTTKDVEPVLEAFTSWLMHKKQILLSIYKYKAFEHGLKLDKRAKVADLKTP